MSNTNASGNGNYTMEEEEQLMFSAITFFGALTILFLSLTVCGKGRRPTAAAKQKSSSKNVKETENSQKSTKKRSSLKTENSKKTQNETTFDKSEASSAMGKPSAIGNDSKQQQKSMKTISKTQEPSENVTQETTLQISTTQASSGTNEIRSTKECGVVTPLDKNKNVSKVDGRTSVKEGGGAKVSARVSARECAPTSNLSTARQQQQLQQPSTLLEDFTQKKSQNEKSEDQEEVLPPRVYAPAPPRNIERDRELAAKALMNFRARRAQNVYSAHAQQSETPQKEEQEVPEENPEENASNASNDEKAAANGGNEKKKSVSSDFPTVDKADIIPEGETIVGANEIEKANKENTEDKGVDDNKDKEDDEEESKKESKKEKKKIKVQHGVYVPPEKRQFKSVKDIPADDITIKRAVKKKQHKKKKDKKKEKKHKKKKSKKRSDSSTADVLNTTRGSRPFQNNNNGLLSNKNGNIKLLQYKISTKKLGEGAFAKVYAARHERTKTNVAMKIIRLDNLDNSYMKLALNEVELLRKTKSQNVVKLHDAFVVQNTYFIALELIDSYDLEASILQMQRHGTVFSERTVWYNFYQICAGLKDLHDKRILHRDLKPANIFITSKMKAKIGDLDLSIRCSSSNSITTYVGREYYMAPERFSGNGYNFPSDIWSLGCILYEICTLRSPFCGETENAYSLHKKINNSDENIIPFSMNIYSEHLQYFTNSCLKNNPNERPTARECAVASKAMHEKFEQMFAECTNKKKTAGADDRRCGIF